MIKTFALGADSHVEIDIKKIDDGKMILTVSVDENTSDKQELSEVKTLEYYLGKTVEFGLMDKTYKWKKHITQPQIALWVDMCSNLVGLENKWVWAESMWGLKYNNDPPEHVVENLRNLCKEVLEPLREHFGVPVVITSGYRSALLNSLVGGGINSQHKYGEAADIFIPKYDFIASDGERHTNMDIARRWFEWIRTNTDFDQVILETSNRKDFWIHVSCRRDRRLNRHNHIAYLIKSSYLSPCDS